MVERSATSHPNAHASPSSSALPVQPDKQHLQSLLQRIGMGGVIRLTLSAIICLANLLLYTLLPLAGLGFLPFLFFGCVCLMIGMADDAGYYR